MKRSTFSAMGTSVVAIAPSVRAIAATRTLFEEAELAFSRFISDSELCLVNGDPRTEVPVSPILAAVLAAAADARRLSDGLVDVGIGSAIQDWGYDRTFADLEAVSAAPTRARRGTWSVQGSTLRRAPETTIDLGGVAKGWTCDLAVDRGIASIVSAGGDVRSSDPEAAVEVIDPWGTLAAVIRLGIGALATSSVTRRRWRVGEGDANHLIDPRTMSPTTSPILSATAITATAADAETAAKTVLLMGADGLAWADRQSWIRGALVVWHDGSIYGTTGLEVAA